MPTKPASNSSSEPGPTTAQELAAAFVARQTAKRSAGSQAHASSAARHFLRWLDAQRVPPAAIDDDVVARFGRHRCRCPRYRPRQLRDPAYLGEVRRFVCHLQDDGYICAPQAPFDVDRQIEAFAGHLGDLGHGDSIRLGYATQGRHLAAWLRLSRLAWSEIDDAVVERFAHHACHCPITAKRGTRVGRAGPAQRRRGAQRFVDYLRARGLIPLAGSPSSGPSEDPRLSAYRTWLKRERGATDVTIRRYVGEAARWLSVLGSDPARYTVAAVRAIVQDQEAARSAASIRMTVTVLRSFLRFTAGTDAGQTFLYEAVPTAHRRQLASLPRAVPATTIESIIASCDTTTALGLRDRAIVLLLARLGLRAAEVWGLHLGDVDWRSGRLRLHGKPRRAVVMPLPQDAGDALLDYLERGRPSVAEDRVFLRAQAPFTALRSASEIAGIVARVLHRGGFTDLPRGAHMFRHSLATNLLRAGSPLDAIGAVLRHRRPETTAIYAKVDTTMLMGVAQPWPGDASC